MADAKRISFGSQLGRGTSSAPAFSNFTLNQTNDAAEWIVQAPAAATVTRLGIRLGVITGTTPTYRVSAQGVTSAGVPDGTIKGATNNALKTFSPSGLGWTDGEWHWLTLDETFAVTRGEVFAIVVDYSSGTVDGSNNASFTIGVTNTNEPCFPYPIQNNAASRAKQAIFATVGWGSAETAYGRPIESLTITSFSAGSTPDEYAVKFTLPAAWGDTFKLVGVKLPTGFNAAAQTITFVLYDSDGSTALQNVTHDGDYVSATNTRMGYFYFDEATLATLSYGTAYRLAIRPDGTGTASITEIVVDASGDAEAWPGGDIFSASTRTDAGAWTDSALSRYDVELIFDDITESSNTFFPMSASVMQGFRPTMAAY